MLRTMDTVRFCEQIKGSARLAHFIMTWRDRDHINNTLMYSTGVSRNSGQRKTEDELADNRSKPDKLQRYPQLFMTSPASHRLRILSSDQSHRKKLTISKSFKKHSSQTFKH